MKKTLLAAGAAIAIACLAGPASAQFAGFGGFEAFTGGYAATGGSQGANTRSEGTGSAISNQASTNRGSAGAYYESGVNSKNQSNFATGTVGDTRNTSQATASVGDVGSRNFHTDAGNEVTAIAGVGVANGQGVRGVDVGGTARSRTGVDGSLSSFRNGGDLGTSNSQSTTYGAQAGASFGAGYLTRQGADNNASAQSYGNTQATFEGNSVLVGNGSIGYQSGGSASADSFGGGSGRTFGVPAN